MTDTEIQIPQMVGGGNYTLALHARLVQHQADARAQLDKANKLLKEAESSALSTRTFAAWLDDDVQQPPRTVLMDGKAVTISFTTGRGGGWTYTTSEVAS